MNLLLLLIALLLAGCFYHLFCISIERQELNEMMNITDRRMRELQDRNDE